MHPASTQVTGHGLLLPRDPVDDTRALAVAYARYLAACCQRFLTVESKLAAGLRPAHASIAALVRQALAIGKVVLPSQVSRRHRLATQRGAVALGLRFEALPRWCLRQSISPRARCASYRSPTRWR